MDDLHHDPEAGILVIDQGLRINLAGHAIDVFLTPDECRQLAVSLALAADRREGLPSHPAARLVAEGAVGNA